MTRSTTNLLLAASFSLVALLGAGCRPKYPNCDNDSQCHEGEFCVNGRCQQCRTNADCPEGQSCNAGACQDIPGYCSANRPCPAGQECQNNRCVTPVTTECDSARPCPAGQECQNGTCVSAAPPPPACQPQAVYFEFDRSDLGDDDRSTLQSDANCIRERSLSSVHVTGRADPRGTEEYNLALGERRARSARQYLESLGVSGISISSRGEEDATGSDEASWANDRRADVGER